MNPELGIVVLHHHVDEVFEQNLESMRFHNPEAVVCTISCNHLTPPGGYTFNGTPDLWSMFSVPTCADLLLLSFWRQKKESAQKWLVAEWDVFCRCSVKQYYGPVWNEPFVASTVMRPWREHDWPWFAGCSYPKGTNLMGIVPFLFLANEEVLDKVCDRLPDTRGTNSEVRLATAAAECGYPPCAYSPPNDHITWHDCPLDPAPVIYHCVKQIVPEILQNK